MLYCDHYAYFYLYKKHTVMKKLSKEEQLDLFQDLFGSYELIEAYIESGEDFCEEAELKLFDLKDPTNQDMIELYIEKGHKLSEAAEQKLFDLPMGEMLLETYCFAKEKYLQPQAQLRLLSMPDTNLAKRYIRFHKKTPYLSAAFIDQAKKQGLM